MKPLRNLPFFKCRALWTCMTVALSVFHIQCEQIFAPGYEVGIIPSSSGSNSRIPVSFNRLQYVYSGQFSQSPKGEAIYSLSILQTVRGVLSLGDLKIKGKITPVTPGSPIPAKMRISFRHKNVQGNLLRTKNFDFNVTSDGVILLQTFPQRDAIAFSPKEILEINVVAVDKAFPAGQANLTMTYVEPAPGT